MRGQARTSAQGAAMPRSLCATRLTGPNKTGTGSEPISANPGEDACREVPVPVLLGPLRDLRRRHSQWTYVGGGAIARLARCHARLPVDRDYQVNCQRADHRACRRRPGPPWPAAAGAARWPCCKRICGFCCPSAVTLSR
jgi:hypothetical protein